jgi:hypothetical protein
MAKRIARGGKVLSDLYPGDKIKYGNLQYVAFSKHYWSHTSIVSINNGILKLNNGSPLMPETIIYTKKFKYGQKLKELQLHDGGDHGKISDYYLKLQKSKDDIEEEFASKIGELFGGDRNDDQAQSGESPRCSKRIGVGVNPPKRLAEGGDDTPDRQKRKHDSTVTQLGESKMARLPSGKKTS